MSSRSLIAAAMVVLMATAGAIALTSIDSDQVRPSVAVHEKIQMTPEEAASVLPTPQVAPDPTPHVFVSSDAPRANRGAPHLLLTIPPMYKVDGTYVVPKGMPGVDD